MRFMSENLNFQSLFMVLDIFLLYAQSPILIREKDMPATTAPGQMGAARRIMRVVKVGARVVYHARRWYVHVASAFPLARYYRILLA